MKIVSYGKQSIDNKDINQVSRVLKRDVISSGDIVQKFEKNLSNYLNSKYSIVCNSGTSALHLAFQSVDLKKGDIVLMPAINFIASYNLCSMLGAKIYLIDIDLNTGQISYKSVLDCIKKNKIKKIKIIITMYLGGYITDNIKIFNLKKKYKFFMIEDACHAFGSDYFYKRKKYKLGSCKHSDLSVFSFHPLKTITTGEGGLISTNKKIFFDKLKNLRSHGIIKNKKKHWDYDIKSPGYNYRLSDINCALGLSQLKKMNKFLSKRKKIAKDYVKKLKPIFKYVSVLNMDKIENSCCHLIILKINFKYLKIKKNDFISLFLDKGFFLQQHYKPIYLFDVFKNKKQKFFFKQSNLYFDTCLSFPIHFQLTKLQLDKCIDLLKRTIFKNKID